MYDLYTVESLLNFYGTVALAYHVWCLIQKKGYKHRGVALTGTSLLCTLPFCILLESVHEYSPCLHINRLIRTRVLHAGLAGSYTIFP